MKQKTLKTACLMISFVLMLGMLLPLTVDAKVTDPTPVGYSAGNVTTSLPDAAVNILTLAADGSNYASDMNSAYYIEDAAGLVRLSALVNQSQAYAFSGKSVYLKNDIDMADMTDFVPIGNHSNGEVNAPDRYFRGVFDGLGYSIKNLTVTSDTRLNNALFGAVRGCVIRNLVIDESCSFSYTGTSSDARTAAIVACAVRNGGDSSYLSKVDGVEASVFIDNVCNNAEVCATNGNTGGIVAGGAAGTSYRLYIRNCTNHGKVSITNPSSAKGAGGIVARLESSNRGIIIRNCLNTGDVSAHFFAAGIMADILSSNLSTEIINCENRGNIIADQVAGGIMGGMRYDTIKLQQCRNYGEVTLTGKGNTSDAISKGYSYGFMTNTGKDEKVTDFVNYRFAGVMLHGYQLGEVKADENGTSRRAVRLVASVDSLDYSAVGFDIEASYGDKTQSIKDRSCTTVYSSLLASDEKGEVVGVTAELLRGAGSRLYALTLEGLAVSISEITFTVTPYYVKDGVKTAGETVTFTVDLGSEG